MSKKDKRTGLSHAELIKIMQRGDKERPSVVNLDSSDENWIASWMKEYELGLGSTLVKSSKLYNHFKEWALKQGAGRVANPNAFGLFMQDRTIKKVRRSEGRYYCLNRNPTDDEEKETDEEE